MPDKNAKSMIIRIDKDLRNSFKKVCVNKEIAMNTQIIEWITMAIMEHTEDQHKQWRIKNGLDPE